MSLGVPTTAASKVPTPLSPTSTGSPTIQLPSPPSASSASPSSVNTSSTLYYQRTNTLAITSLPKTFFHPTILDVLRHHCEGFGEINQWVPLPGFGRIIVVFYDEDCAESAKLASDPIVLNRNGAVSEEQVVLRVYRADPNPLIPPEGCSAIPASNFLRPPAIERNFLISPPGSPPEGWEPIREDPPNPTPLADDLMSALKELQLQDRFVRNPDGKKSTLEVLLDPTEGSGVGVYVENYDQDEDEDVEMDNDTEEQWVYGVTSPTGNRWRQFATALPPIQTIVL